MKFRDNGAIGALLDEYERAINELIDVISDLSIEELMSIVDPQTTDEDCISIQSILSHVVRSGYNYVIEIRKWLGEHMEYSEKVYLPSVVEYIEALRDMFRFNEQLFMDYPNMVLEENDPLLKIKVRWGQYYDVEQLIEHAIVHILRHRRQIERFKLRL